MAYLRLFHRLFLRPLARERARTALTVFAVALGVAVVLAIQLAGTAAAGSFRASLETLAGKADLEVTGTAGVAPEVLATLESLPAPLRLTPRMEDYAEVAGTGETVPLIGLDLLSASPGGEGAEPWKYAHPVWVGARLAHPGGTLRLTINDRTADFTVAGILKDRGQADNVVVMDLAQADEVLGRQGRLDRILVGIPEGAGVAEWQARLRGVVPAGVTVSRQGARTGENRRMLAAFRWNLRVLSYIALVVGAFLIYNTISVSVVRRRAEIGILRAMGAARSGVQAAFLAEAALFGAAGAFCGLFLGRAMAEGAVKMIGATVQSLYVSSSPAPIRVTPETVLFGLFTGTGIALASALAPAREASLVAPVEAMARGRAEYTARVGKWRDLVLGLALACAAGGASLAPPVAGMPVFGYLAALLLIAAAALAIPALVSLVAALSSRLLRALAVEWLLASRSLAASLRRTSVLVGALCTAIAMMTSVGIMVGSFRQTVLLWMDNQLQADLYIRPAGPSAADRYPVMSADIADRIAALPGVEAVDRYRAIAIHYGGLPATLGAGETGVMSRFSRMRFLSGRRQEILRKLPAGDYVVVSEPFANKHHIRRGDRLVLNPGGRTGSFEVLGVYYDYSSERGFVMMDRRTLLQYMPDPSPSNLAVYLKPGTDLEAARVAIQRAAAGRRILILSNRALRTEAIRIFDRTFAITYALEAVAVAVAVMGIAGALLALVIDRRRELGLLRFLGASARQVRRLILFEAGLLGLLANVSGLLLGYALSLILIYVINKQSFGWTIQFHWPVAVLAGALALIDAATIAAAFYPAGIAARLNPIEVVHDE